jgi:hypothetical protein
MYLKAAERAFYRNPFSDLLIISFSALNSEDDRWKGLQLPMLLVPDSGAVPRATQREISRRKRVNLFVWGDPDTVADEMLNELATITRGKVYRILAHRENEVNSPAEEVLDPPGASENVSDPDIEEASNGENVVESLEDGAGDADCSPGEKNDTEKSIKIEGEIKAENDYLEEQPALPLDAAENEKWPADALIIAESNLDLENQKGLEAQDEKEDSPEQEHFIEQETYEQETYQAPPMTAAEEIAPSGHHSGESHEINGAADIQAPGDENASAKDNVLLDTEQTLLGPEELISALMAKLAQVETPPPPAKATSQETQGDTENIIEDEAAEDAISGWEDQPDDEVEKEAAENESDEETIKETGVTELAAGKNIIVWRFPK